MIYVIGAIAIIEALVIGYLRESVRYSDSAVKKCHETIQDLMRALNRILVDYDIQDTDQYLKHIRNAKFIKK